MTEETFRVLVASGFLMLLVMLRLDAERFGAAEWDEPRSRGGGFPVRLAWYLLGLVLLGAIYVIHPSPRHVLLLVIGPRPEAAVFGLFLAAAGTAQAAAFAMFRYGYLRLPPISGYASAILNSIGTAVLDEALFRGVVLGTLLAVGMPDAAAIVAAALAYVLIARMAARGRHPYMLALTLAMGLAFGWATVVTGGLGAAVIGHAVTSFAVFICTGHAGQVPASAANTEDADRRSRAPQGWQDAWRPLSAGRGAESGFVDRAERRAASRRQAGPLAWLRSRLHRAR
jgi:membrane protease YdiL (CAAX protease family)